MSTIDRDSLPLHRGAGARRHHLLSLRDHREVISVLDILASLTAPRLSDLRVLELASGAGRLTLPIAAAGHQVLATDIEPDVLEHLGARINPEPSQEPEPTGAWFLPLDMGSTSPRHRASTTDRPSPRHRAPATDQPLPHHQDPIANQSRPRHRDSATDWLHPLGMGSALGSASSSGMGAASDAELGSLPRFNLRERLDLRMAMEMEQAIEQGTRRGRHRASRRSLDSYTTPDHPLKVGLDLADMTSFSLKERFKAVCLPNSSVTLLAPRTRRNTLGLAASHLAPGGVLIVCTEYVLEDAPPSLSLSFGQHVRLEERSDQRRRRLTLTWGMERYSSNLFVVPPLWVSDALTRLGLNVVYQHSRPDPVVPGRANAVIAAIKRP